MESDWFLYSITLCTFIVIFLMCYIRHAFTFFERNNVCCVSNPMFPFGNIFSVVSQKRSMPMQLWQLHRKLRKRKRDYGGFYIFLSPAVLTIDATLPKKYKLKSAFNNKRGTDSTYNNLILRQFSNYFCTVWCAVLGNGDTEINMSEIIENHIFEFCTQELFGLKLSRADSQQLRSFLFKQPLLDNFGQLISISNPSCSRIFHKIFNNEKWKTLIASHLKETCATKSENGKRHDHLLDKLIEDGVAVQNMVDIFLEVFSIFRGVANMTLLTLYELCHNEEIQLCLREESSLQEVNRKKKYENLYIAAVICECLRKYPPRSFEYMLCESRSETQEPWLKNEDLPLFLSILGVHHDEKNYFNPGEFNPQRFMNNPELLNDCSRFFPFGINSTDCLDLLHSKLMKIIISELIPRSQFSYTEKSPKSIRFIPSFFSLILQDEMWFKIKPCINNANN